MEVVTRADNTWTARLNVTLAMGHPSANDGCGERVNVAYAPRLDTADWLLRRDETSRLVLFHLMVSLKMGFNG